MYTVSVYSREPRSILGRKNATNIFLKHTCQKQRDAFSFLCREEGINLLNSTQFSSTLAFSAILETIYIREYQSLFSYVHPSLLHFRLEKPVPTDFPAGESRYKAQKTSMRLWRGCSQRVKLVNLESYRYFSYQRSSHCLSQHIMLRTRYPFSFYSLFSLFLFRSPPANSSCVSHSFGLSPVFDVLSPFLLLFSFVFFYTCPGIPLFGLLASGSPFSSTPSSSLDSLTA